MLLVDGECFFAVKTYPNTNPDQALKYVLQSRQTKRPMTLSLFIYFISADSSTQKIHPELTT